jgi:hypothetical protein
MALILSRALDTNGQNRRYGVAAEKFGSDPDVLKALAIGKDDPGGVVGRFQLAAEKFGSLSIRSVHRVSHYFDFPGDIVWTRHNERQIRGLIDDADIVHLNNSPVALQRFPVRKPMLLHHHGSLFRNNPAHLLEAAASRRMLQAVSTIDLARVAPDLLHWLPTAYDIGALAAFAKKREVLKHRIRPDGRIRIVSAPTNRELKSTAQLIAAVEHLQSEGLPVDLELIEGKTNLEVLTAKATADIVFDQTMFGYGCNAVEAWGMGVPVIAGADPWTLDAMDKAWGYLPFYTATDATIADAIRSLATSKDLRDLYGCIGYDHVKKYHDEKPALERLAELYGMAIKHYSTAANARTEPVTFRNPKGRPLYNPTDGQRFVFEGGALTVDDPYIVSYLRKFARLRPNFGIEEVA